MHAIDNDLLVRTRRLVREAVGLSFLQDQIVTLEPEGPSEYESLVDRLDQLADNGSHGKQASGDYVAEYWGASWRVHVIRPY